MACLPLPDGIRVGRFGRDGNPQRRSLDQRDRREQQAEAVRRPAGGVRRALKNRASSAWVSSGNAVRCSMPAALQAPQHVALQVEQQPVGARDRLEQRGAVGSSSVNRVSSSGPTS